MWVRPRVTITPAGGPAPGHRWTGCEALFDTVVEITDSENLVVVKTILSCASVASNIDTAEIPE